MSWRCTGATNAELVANLVQHSLISHPRVRNAFNSVDRAHFCPPSSAAAAGEPYLDAPQRIGFDATISAPHMHANATEALHDYLQPGCRVLDVGCGSGYLCAVFGHLVADPEGRGKVVGLEHIPQLCQLSIQNLRKSPVHAKMLDQDKTISIVKGDGRVGYPEGGPYDAIHVGAAAKGFPQPLIDQLNAPGRMFIPVEDGSCNQYIYQVDKDKDGNVTKTRTFGVMYVPLTDEKEF